MQEIDRTVLSIIQGGVGNKRIIDLNIQKGVLSINGQNETVIFEIETEYLYSQVDREVESGGLTMITNQDGSIYNVVITANYSEYDLTFNDENSIHRITEAPTSYRISIENKGGDKTKINFIIS